MSPERAGGDLDSIGPRSDVYSIGAILYHLLAGRAPYVEAGARTSPWAVWARVREGPPAPLEDLAPDEPPELVAISEKSMARDPRDRYGSVEELSEELRAFPENRVRRAHRTRALIEFR